MNLKYFPDLSLAIKAEALRLGFSACGIAPAGAVDEAAAEGFRHWLSSGHQAGMGYMENYPDKRLDPRRLVEGTRSIISVALNYYPAVFIPAGEYQLAWYAYGKDYHEVMKTKLSALQEFLLRIDPTLMSRTFCDTAPVLERYWAWRAGLGWIGKNTQLILPRSGSCFFLGELFIDTAVDVYDTPQKNRCGSCTRCLEACPTQALDVSREIQGSAARQASATSFSLDSNRCLSYLTIEHRDDIPSVHSSKMGDNIYGCDLCLKACPWNRFSTSCRTPEFHPSLSLLSMRKSDWHSLTEEQYKALFKGSAVKRAKYKGLLRNILAAKG